VPDLPLSKEGMTDTEIAGDFILHEFKKGQEFFLLKLHDLMFEQQIGTGASAEVYKGTYKEMDVAIKKLRFTPNPDAPNPILEFKREVSTLIKTRHPNLVLFVGACVDKGHVMVVTEYCFGGSLFSLLHEKRATI
jgi:serine/threonine protein kinase